jgi:hypothetical protein
MFDSLHQFDIDEINDYILLLERKLKFYKSTITTCEDKYNTLGNSPYKAQLSNNISKFKNIETQITLELELLQEIKNKLK